MKGNSVTEFDLAVEKLRTNGYNLAIVFDTSLPLDKPWELVFAFKDELDEVEEWTLEATDFEDAKKQVVNLVHILEDGGHIEKVLHA